MLITGPGLKASAAFAATTLHDDVSNFFLLEYRRVDGFLITAKNSGTHWLRHMLSHALAEQYGFPPPETSSGEASDDYIGHPRRPPRRPGTPRIGSSHNIPSRLFAAPLIRRALPLPPTVVLVRDLKEALLSFYVKWKDVYGVELSEFVRGDPSGRRYQGDVWWYLRFFNAWGDFARSRPDRTLVVRYEDLQADPARWIAAVGGRWGVAFTDAAIARALAVSGREAVKARLDEAGARAGVVADAGRREAIRYSAEDQAVLDAILRGRLRHDFGYGYVEKAAERAA